MSRWPTYDDAMEQAAQPSVFSKPWYWVLIGLGIVAIVVLSLLAVTARAGAEGQNASAAQGSSEKQTPREYGDGASPQAALKPGTEVEATYGADWVDPESPDSEVVDSLATITVVGANFDATAEALAEDPWADLMLEPDEKLVIVDLEITNHASTQSLSILGAEMIQLEDESGELYRMDVVRVALDQEEVPGAQFPKDEPVTVVAVYTVPKELNAGNTAVRIQTNTELDPKGSQDIDDPNAFLRTYTYSATE